MNRSIINPFIVTGKYVSAEYFCDREAETAELVSNIENWRNTVLVSERRMGKSGLISHTFASGRICDNYDTFFIDIFDSTSLEDFVILLSKEIAGRLQSRESRLLERFITIVSSLKLTFSVDLFTGFPTADITLGESFAPGKTLEQLFFFLESNDIPCVVAIDEFQQIAEYPDGSKVIAQLRSLVQSCKKTRFIFAGSNRRMMNKIFNTPSEPFFMSCTPLYLGTIDICKYVTFCQEWFENFGKRISEECVVKAYELYEGHTWYVQYVMNRVFEMTPEGALADADAVAPAVEHILGIFGQTFQEMFLQLSEKQRELLKAVSKEGYVSSPTSVAFIKKHRLASASAIQGALRPLIENETLIHTDKGYRITNRFYSQWLKLRY
ncbi:MAG: ATPase [Bacteroidales bacterium]|nr:ATPase [Bacteroidales bacterium]